AEEEADLLDLQLVRLAEERLHDHEVVAAVVLQLGPLSAVEDVLQGQGMESEVLAKLLDELDVVEPLDVDPGDRLGVAVGEDVLDLRDLLLLEVFRPVVDDADPRRSGAGDLAQGARRRTRLVVPLTDLHFPPFARHAAPPPQGDYVAKSSTSKRESRFRAPGGPSETA